MEDQVFKWTANINNYFAQNKSSRHAFMIICGGMMDLMVMVSFFRFAVKGTSWRFPLAILSFYIFRLFVQKLFFMRYPDGYLWDFPGIYSMTVPYGTTNDFFYSGHIGMCMLCFLEFKANLWNKWAYYSLVTMIFQAMLMIALRGHYVIDLISGVIFAHYFWMYSERLSYLIDVNLLRMPLKKRFPMVTQACQSC